MKLKGAGFDSLDKAIYKWFMNARERNVPVSGTLLKEKAVFFAKELQIEILKVLTAGLIAGKQGTVSKLCTSEMTALWDETTLPTIIFNYKL